MFSIYNIRPSIVQIFLTPYINFWVANTMCSIQMFLPNTYISSLTVFVITTFVFLPSNSQTPCKNKQFLWEYCRNSSKHSPNFDSNDSVFFSTSQIFWYFFPRSLSNSSCFVDSNSNASAREFNYLSPLIWEFLVSLQSTKSSFTF